MKTVSIDPVTRLEGHGRIDIFMDDSGKVANAYLRVPELRGFEEFCVGRPVEELPRITTRICGVCPEAHHMASAKACDAVYHVDPPPAAKKLRRLLYNTFYAADHAVHFYILSGPDFVVGPDAPVAERNVFGLIRKVGVETGKLVIQSRARAQELVKYLGGKSIHQVTSLPGGVTVGLPEEKRQLAVDICRDLVEFGKFTLKILDDVVRKVPDPEVLADLDATLDWTAGDGGDPSRAAITGFCWGGRIVWLYAAHRDGLRAGAAWYGRLGGPRRAGASRNPLDVAAKLKAPVLGLYGAEDQGIPIAAVEAMRTRLAGTESEIVVFPGAPHGFHADYRSSFRRKAAEKGHARAMYGLSIMYEDGRGVGQDRGAAARYVFDALRLREPLVVKEMTTNANAWSREFRRELQRLMRDAGDYDGAIDDYRQTLKLGLTDQVAAAVHNNIC